MNSIPKSLCIFVHYGMQDRIPHYVSIYLSELSFFFDQIILVTNKQSLDESSISHIQNLSILSVRNEGYDFGMFYQAFQTIDPTEYSQIACVNDSNILFNRLLPVFRWSKQVKYDFWGLIDSNEKPWFSTHEENYHIQSHFIVFNQEALLKLTAFFESFNIREIFEEKDLVKLRRLVIDKWEIGLSQFLIHEGLSAGSYIDSKSYASKFLNGKQSNVGYKLYAELIQAGLPVIKKKIIFRRNWRDVFRTKNRWEDLVRQYGNQDWEIESLIYELSKSKSGVYSQIQ